MAIEIKLDKYTLHFRRLTWIEESTLDWKIRKDQRRVLLAATLQKIVLGDQVIPVKNFQEAIRVVDSLTSPILHKVYLLYRGNLPPSCSFSTSQLYKAPAPLEFHRTVEEETENQEKEVDTLLPPDLSPEEMKEAIEVQRKIQESGMPGAVRRNA